MPTVETEFKNFRIAVSKEIALLKKIIISKMIPETWVKQDMACVIVNVTPRQLRNIRQHTDSKTNNVVGSIRWKKGKGRNVLYYLPDLKKYNGEHTNLN